MISSMVEDYPFLYGACGWIMKVLTFNMQYAILMYKCSFTIDI